MKSASQMMPPHALASPANDLRHARKPEHVARLAAYCTKHNDVPRPVQAVKRTDGTLEVLTGETSRLAALEAGLQQISVIVRDTPLSDDEADRERFLENDAREDFTLVESGTFYARRMERLGLTQAALATDLGKSETEVSRALKVFRSCAPEVQAMVARGELCGSVAAIIARLDDHAKQIELARKRPKRDAAIRLVRGIKGKRERKPRKVKIDLGDGVTVIVPSDLDYQEARKALRAAVARLNRGEKISDGEVAAPVVLGGA